MARSKALVAAGLLVVLVGCSSAAAVGAQASGGDAEEAARVERDVGIPVLVFHQICAEACAPTDTYGITQAELTRTMSSIKRAGYETISLAAFARAHAGDAAGLPKRPILVTFDDGRLDAYRGADPVLRELGMQATMFVITSEAVRNPRFSMQWPEIRQAAASGRWSIQLHAHAGHVQIKVGVDAQRAPMFGAFYGWREWRDSTSLTEDGAGLESFAEWKERAEQDIDTGDAQLASELGPALYSSLSFAVPFNDYGQNGSNDPAIKIELRAFLDARFAVWFTQPSADPPFMTPSATNHEVARYRVVSTTTAETVDAWLTRHRPVSPSPQAGR